MQIRTHFTDFEGINSHQVDDCTNVGQLVWLLSLGIVVVGARVGVGCSLILLSLLLLLTTEGKESTLFLIILAGLLSFLSSRIRRRTRLASERLGVNLANDDSSQLQAHLASNPKGLSISNALDGARAEEQDGK